MLLLHAPHYSASKYFSIEFDRFQWFMKSFEFWLFREQKCCNPKIRTEGLKTAPRTTWVPPLSKNRGPWPQVSLQRSTLNTTLKTKNIMALRSTQILEQHFVLPSHLALDPQTGLTHPRTFVGIRAKRIFFSSALLDGGGSLVNSSLSVWD